MAEPTADERARPDIRSQRGVTYGLMFAGRRSERRSGAERRERTLGGGLHRHLAPLYERPCFGLGWAGDTHVMNLSRFGPLALERCSTALGPLWNGGEWADSGATGGLSATSWPTVQSCEDTVSSPDVSNGVADSGAW